MNNPDTRISLKHLSQESVDRLHLVNQIRNILAVEHQLLTSLHIIAVYAFGSTTSGNSNVDSDIDLCFVINPHLGHHSPATFKNEIGKILSQIDISILFHTPEENQKGKSIHVTTDLNDKVESPGFAEDGILLWSKPSSSPSSSSPPAFFR